MSNSHIRIPNEFFRVPEYIEFDKVRKSNIYRFLQTAIIRGSEEVKTVYHGAHYIYKEHFIKGQLVARYSQKKMEKYLGTSQGAISRYLKELEQDGFIKKIVRPTKIGNINYYQFGTYEGEYGKDTYKETIWLDEHFTKIYENRKKADSDNRWTSSIKYMMEPFETWDDFIYDMTLNGHIKNLDQESKMKSIWNECKEDNVCPV